LPDGSQWAWQSRLRERKKGSWGNLKEVRHQNERIKRRNSLKRETRKSGGESWDWEERGRSVIQQKPGRGRKSNPKRFGGESSFKYLTPVPGVEGGMIQTGDRKALKKKKTRKASKK